jgi:ribonuclease J
MAIGRIHECAGRRGGRNGHRPSGASFTSPAIPGRPELAALYDWLRPDILVPVHGEMRHIAEQARFGRAHGIPNAVVQNNGEIIRLAPGKPGKLAEVRAGRLVLDGDIITAADGDAITMRRRIAGEGVLVVVLARGAKPVIEAIGLPLDEDLPDFLEEAADDVLKAIGRLKGRDAKDEAAVREAARLAARRAAQRWAGKKPQVRVVMPGAGA